MLLSIRPGKRQTDFRTQGTVDSGLIQKKVFQHQDSAKSLEQGIADAGKVLRECIERGKKSICSKYPGLQPTWALRNWNHLNLNQQYQLNVY